MDSQAEHECNVEGAESIPKETLLEIVESLCVKDYKSAMFPKLEFKERVRADCLILKKTIDQYRLSEL